MSTETISRIVIEPDIKHTGSGSPVMLYSFGEKGSDPFLSFRYFELNENDGFPVRFYKGIEEFIYILDGKLHHSDDLGNSKTLKSGDAQRIITGKGLHMRSVAENGTVKGISLWLNTCIEDRLTLPDYSFERSDDMPVTASEGQAIKTICGEDSPLRVCGEVIIRDIEISEGQTILLPLNIRHRTFLFLVNGEATIGEESLNEKQALFINGDDHVYIHCSNAGRIIQISACPVKDAPDLDDIISAF